MKKYILLSFLVAFFCQSIDAQNYKDNRKEAERKMSDKNLYCAESGSCASFDEADAKAIDNLIHKISEEYQANCLYFPDMNQAQNKKEIFETCRNFIASYSSRIVLEREANNASVFRYMEKKEFLTCCNDRKALILKYIDEGYNKEDANIDNSLRLYYWALMLCYSHPDGAKLVFEDPENYVETDIQSWLVNRINLIFNEININVLQSNKIKDGHNYELRVCYNGRTSYLVSGMKLEYFNGEDMIPNMINDGVCLIQLRDKDLDAIDIEIDLRCENEARNYHEVKMVMDVMRQKIYFAGANRRISLKNVKPQQPDFQYNDSLLEQQAEEAAKMLQQQAVKDNACLKAMNAIEKAIRENKYESARDYFSQEGYDMFMNLKYLGKIIVVRKPEYIFLEYGGEIICRSIPLQCDFRNNAGFSKNVVFRFDAKTNLVTSIAFRLDRKAEEDILGKGEWDMDSRMQLVNFMEDYQTAYALKRIDYLDQIFSEDALIIVGRVLKNTKKTDDIQLAVNEDKVETIVKSKSEYINSLRAAFDSREYVNLNFTDTDFSKASNGEEVYGVKVKQEYMSSTYNDVGYLFLFVDLRGELPVIHIRVWQPNETPSEDVVELISFRWS